MREYTDTMVYLDSLMFYILTIAFCLYGLLIDDGTKATIALAITAAAVLIVYFYYYLKKGTKKIDDSSPLDPNKVYENTRFVMLSRALSAISLLTAIFIVPRVDDMKLAAIIYIAACIVLATASFLMIRKKLAHLSASSGN